MHPASSKEVQVDCWFATDIFSIMGKSDYCFCASSAEEMIFLHLSDTCKAKATSACNLLWDSWA